MLKFSLFKSNVSNYLVSDYEKTQHTTQKNMGGLLLHTTHNSWLDQLIDKGLGSFYDLLTFGENTAYMFLDFLLVGNLNVTIAIVLFSLLFNKLIMLFKKMITHEKSKKLYFLFYLLAVSVILAQCLILVTSRRSEVSDQGILLLYIYATAILMLFLIFLAITTCESYLFKEQKIEPITSKISITSLVINTTTIVFFFLYFHYTMYDAVSCYFLKTNVMLSSNDLGLSQIQANSRCANSIYKYNSFHQIGSVNKSWSIFDSLKFDIIDNYTNYLLSALLQTCALVIVIISLII